MSRPLPKGWELWTPAQRARYEARQPVLRRQREAADKLMLSRAQSEAFGAKALTLRDDLEGNFQVVGNYGPYRNSPTSSVGPSYLGADAQEYSELRGVPLYHGCVPDHDRGGPYVVVDVAGARWGPRRFLWTMLQVSASAGGVAVLRFAHDGSEIITDRDSLVRMSAAMTSGKMGVFFYLQGLLRTPLGISHKSGNLTKEVTS